MHLDPCSINIIVLVHLFQLVEQVHLVTQVPHWLEETISLHPSLSLTAAQTRSIKAGRYLYSVEVYNDAGHVLRVAEGQVEINPGSADPDGNIPLPPTPTLSEIIDDRIDDKLVLKAPLASPTFTGDVVVDGSIKLSQIPTYADNFAASSLSIGSVYKTPTGELRIKY